MIKRSPIQYFALIQTCWKYAGEKRKHLVLVYLLSGASVLFLIAQISCFGKIINAMQNGGDNLLEKLLYLFAAYAALGIGFWVFHAPSRVLERKTAFAIRKNYTESLYRIVTEMPMQWHQEHHSGNTIDRINKAANGLYMFADFQFMYIQSICLFFGAAIAMTFIFPIAGIIVVTASVLIFIMLIKFDAVLIKLQKQQNEQEHKLSSGLFDYISNIFTVITLRLERTSREEISRRIESIFPPLKKSIYMLEIKWFAMFFFIILLECTAVLSYILWSFEAGSVIMIGTAVVLYQYTKRISESFRSFAIYYYELIRNYTNMTAVDALLEDYENLAIEETFRAPEDWKTIKICNLTFIHEDKKHRRHRLRDVSITLERGKRIALVGASGSGKSSLMSLIRGLYRIEGASTIIDGERFEGLSPLYPVSTLVPQEPEIFENTIGYNITVGLPYERDAVQKAVDAACFNNVVEQFPEGLETDIREKGVNLSGGQKQRLALARGVLSASNRSLILLDEPTSSIDAVTEKQIYLNMFSCFSNHCIVSSVHRLHLLPEFDYVYVMEDGRIIEEGTFNELIKANGFLAKSWLRYQGEN